MRLIDADRLKQSFMADYITTKLFDTAMDLSDALRQINHAPTIEAEPVRHGKFIGTEYDGYADGYPVYYEWKCSECGCVFEDEEPTYKYCPNCGARMDANEKI